MPFYQNRQKGRIFHSIPKNIRESRYSRQKQKNLPLFPDVFFPAPCDFEQIIAISTRNPYAISIQLAVREPFPLAVYQYSTF